MKQIKYKTKEDEEDIENLEEEKEKIKDEIFDIKREKGKYDQGIDYAEKTKQKIIEDDVKKWEEETIDIIKNIEEK